MARDGYDKRATDRTIYDREYEKQMLKEELKVDGNMNANGYSNAAAAHKEILSQSIVNEVQSGKHKGVVIVLVGPPHSGKSCLKQYLYDHFNRNIVQFIDMTPDGENPAPEADDTVENDSGRNKGGFTEEFIQSKLESLKFMKENVPIVIADLGGAFSAEKPAIFELADHAIVLSNDKKEATKWVNESLKYNVSVLANLTSMLGDGFDEVTYASNSALGTMTGVIYGLERGKKKEPTEVTDLLTSKITATYTRRYGYPEQVQKDIEKGNIDLNTFASMNGQEFNEKTQLYHWDVEALNPTIRGIADELGLQSYADFTNCFPQFLVGAVTQCASDMGIDDIKFLGNKTRPLVTIPTNHKHLKPQILNERISVYKVFPKKNLEAIVTETEKAIQLEFTQVGGSEKITSKDLAKLRLPNLDSKKELIITGNASDVLISSTVQTYKNKEKFIKQAGLGIVQIGSEDIKNIGRTTVGHKELNTLEGKYMYDTRLHDRVINLDGIGSPQVYIDNIGEHVSYMGIPYDGDYKNKNIKKNYSIAEIIRAAMLNGDVILKPIYDEKVYGYIFNNYLNNIYSPKDKRSITSLRDFVHTKVFTNQQELNIKSLDSAAKKVSGIIKDTNPVISFDYEAMEEDFNTRVMNIKDRKEKDGKEAKDSKGKSASMEI